MSTEAARRTGHPLDPLSEDEYRRVVRALRQERDVDERWRFASIDLAEPPKADLKAFKADDIMERTATAVLWNRRDGKAYKALVSLSRDRVTSFEHVPNVQPPFTPDEWHECDEIMRNHPAVQAAMAKRGVTDIKLALIDVWAWGGSMIPEKYHGRRLGWCDVWVRKEPGANPYARYLDGLHPIVDLNTMELLELEDAEPVDPPPIMGEYVPRHLTGQSLREDLKRLEIHQPEGVSFELDGYELRWQNWRMRLGFTHREGPVLHQLAYADGDRLRPIAHRISFAEMVVPYRDPTPNHYRRTAFDIGEWGLGVMTTSLELGCDCLGDVRYVDVCLVDSHGEPYTVTNALCLHEEDNAVLWKHVDAEAGAEVRRMRRMVVSCHITVANYEYLVYWRFYQDGNIECEARATGIMVTTAFNEGEQPATGTIVDQRTYAPFHQHFLVTRLDLDIDGTDNTVVMSESEALPIGPDNPYGLALVQRTVPLRTEEEGKQDYNWATQRGWKIISATQTNAVGAPTAYKLVPGATFPVMMAPESPVLQRASVIKHTLWVTPYAETERWPAGEFPTQAVVDTGLPAWTAQNRSIEGTDVVLWYVWGIHHITRVEDWPVMPVDTVSFWLKPFGFFDRNPALDVAPSPPEHCHSEMGAGAEHHGGEHHVATPP
jgi:primary-amine oxidase